MLSRSSRSRWLHLLEVRISAVCTLATLQSLCVESSVFLSGVHIGDDLVVVCSKQCLCRQHQNAIWTECYVDGLHPAAAGASAAAQAIDPERAAQSRDGAAADVDRLQYSWMQRRAPFSPGNLIERLFGKIKDDLSLAPPAEDGLKRKREVHFAGTDVPQSTDKVPRTMVPFNPGSANLLEARMPIACAFSLASVAMAAN